MPNNKQKVKTSKILERKFQKSLIKEIKKRFKGCVVFKADANYIQGIPDLFILYGKNWAALEVKGFEKAHHQPNQDYYVKLFDKMSFSRFIYPENKESVLNEMESAFKLGRNSCTI